MKNAFTWYFSPTTNVFIYSWKKTATTDICMEISHLKGSVSVKLNTAEGKIKISDKLNFQCPHNILNWCVGMYPCWLFFPIKVKKKTFKSNKLQKYMLYTYTL